MTKPIFLVGLPSELDIKQFETIQTLLENKLIEYYVIVYRTNESEIQFKCFYKKDFDDIKFEELKAIVKNELKKS